MMIQSSPFRARWHGRLGLEFRCDRPNHTRMDCTDIHAPLKIQQPFYPEGDRICHGVMLHTAGGLVGGDRLSVQVALQPQAQALLTTPAATKIYSSQAPTDPDAIAATQEINLTIAEGGCLEWLPQETILFNGARYHQHTRVDLENDAAWVGWELTRLGRTARGEQFTQGEWRSQIEVWQGGRLVWIDPQVWQPSPDRLNSVHGLAGAAVVGSFAIVGRSVTAEQVLQARECWLNSPHTPQGEAGVTRLMSGLLCRYRGQSTAEAKHWFTQVWDMLRQQVLHRPPCRPRVW